MSAKVLLLIWSVTTTPAYPACLYNHIDFSAGTCAQVLTPAVCRCISNRKPCSDDIILNASPIPIIGPFWNDAACQADTC